MKKLYVPVLVQASRKMKILQGRRDTIYKMLSKKNDGVVPCFVCGEHVAKEKATLEHILDKAKGGTDDIDNLSISHMKCNNERKD